MGSCFSKKNSSSSSSSPTVPATLPLPDLTSKTKLVLVEAEQNKIPQQPTEDGAAVKKEIFIIKQRKSHERPRNATTAAEQNTPITPPSTSIKVVEIESSSSPSSLNANSNNITTAVAVPTPVRTSSCTKEEVDAILIQCGRLSRSSSGNRKYSGSKRSYDFDHESDGINKSSNDDEYDDNYHYHRHHSRPSHRRTSSREKDVVVEHKRSGSRDRDRSQERRNKSTSSGGSGSRRVSRSPGRRSDNPSATPTTATAAAAAPGKMVPVPARDKTTMGGGESSATGIKRVSVKRSGEIGGGGVRTAASPRSQSPANPYPTRGASNENPQQPSLSRNSSRKADQSRSPYRRNPLNEIDDNCLKSQHDHINKPIAGINNKIQKTKKKKPDERNNKLVQQDVNQVQIVDDEPTQEVKVISVAATSMGVENLKPPQTITRSRSSRRSRDLDINSDTLLNPTTYASLLLEDIQNFHQQNTTAFSLPACVTKACSILDAVADLNSSTSPNISCCAFSGSQGDRSNNDKSNSHASFSAAKKTGTLEVKDPIVESVVFANDDIKEANLHKYITVRRRGEEIEQQQESSGSNSIVGHNWVSSSSWEPNSADSTDRWTSRSNTRDEHTLQDVETGARKLRSSGNHLLPPVATMSGKKSEVGGGGHTSTIPFAAATASM